MNFVQLTQAYLAELCLERTRDYAVRGRPLAGLSVETLSIRWVETYRAVQVLEDEGREGELLDLRSEFDLRGIEPPLHLVAAELNLFTERFQRQLREGETDWAAVEQTEASLADLYARLQSPKN
jgi:hypothetical protein